MTLQSFCSACRVNQQTNIKGEALKWISAGWGTKANRGAAAFVFSVGEVKWKLLLSPHESREVWLVVWHLLLPDVWVIPCDARKRTHFEKLCRPQGPLVISQKVGKRKKKKKELTPNSRKVKAVSDPGTLGTYKLTTGRSIIDSLIFLFPPKVTQIT